jgi:rod shape determining protein RodA
MAVYIKRLDWVLNSAILFLSAASLTSLLSSAKELFQTQLIWLFLGFAVIILFANFDWRPYINYFWFIWGIYIAAIVLLILTYFFAPSIRGVRGWLVFGPLQFQTSEFAKLALIFVYSYFFAKGHVGIAHLKNLLFSLAYLLPLVFLVALQPDMGSALVLFGIWFAYLLISGLRWKHIFLAFVVFAIGFIFMWTNVLKDYQKERVIGLFDPERNPFGFNYSVIQSKIAIGSGGWWGKGFGQGTQTQLEFLPEAQTDFIFAAFIEEWGIIGGLAIISAFLLILCRIIRIGLDADNNFARFICLGTAILFLTHFILNVGSNIGLTPVIGIPFPFLSYGGSNLLLNSLLIGMIQSIVIHKRF